MKQKKRICLQCKSDLLIVDKVTEKIEGSIFPQTTTIYKCSNNICQEKKDKEAAKQLETKKARLAGYQKRQKTENIINKKRV